VRSSYARTARLVSDLQSQVAELKQNAAAEIHEDLRTITQALDGFAERAAREVKELTADVTLVVVEAELALRRAVEEATARLKVIEAKQELSFAGKAIRDNDLTEAETRAKSALRYLKEARSLTANHPAAIAGVQQQTHDLLAAIRGKAQTMKADLDALIARSDRLLLEMTQSPAQPSKKIA
jgi:uncharacterized protein YoxC